MFKAIKSVGAIVWIGVTTILVGCSFWPGKTTKSLDTAPAFVPRAILNKGKDISQSSSDLREQQVRQAAYEEPTTNTNSDRIADKGSTHFSDPDDDEEPPGLLQLALEGMIESLNRKPSKQTQKAIAEALYDEGLELFRQKRYEEAARRFARAADRAEKGSLQEDALFMAAESYFFADKYPSAFDAYRKLLKEYEYTRHMDTVMQRVFAIGRYWDQMAEADDSTIPLNLSDPSRPTIGLRLQAVKAYQTIQMHDPTGPLADDAVMATANLYFRMGRFEDAAYYYDVLRKEYPNSKHLLDAYLLDIQSKLRLYQGPLYDGTPLKEAKKLAEQALVMFGDKLGEERQRLVDILNSIEQEEARRDLALGEYYEKKKKYGAARFYYNCVIKEHPSTKAAQEAKKRLKEIKDLPDEPPNRFEWLIKLFPENE